MSLDYIKDFKAEVSGEYLLIAIKIPRMVCDGCGKVHAPPTTGDLDPSLGALIERSQRPWSGSRWSHVSGNPIPDPRAWGGARYQEALLCDECYAPVNAADSESSREHHARMERDHKRRLEAEEEAKSKVKTWHDKL